ncbi:Translation initiation factor 3 subunit c [Ascosphaera acerosa]|nr:Translation initiation factor 3 subunit c [Ascosphaera acerosa]
MSRFFYGGASDSDSEEDESVYSEEESSEEEVNASGDDVESSSEEGSGDEEEDSDEESSSDDEGGARKGPSIFLKGASDDEESSDEEKVTVVKSAKDKRLEELEAMVKIIENGMKIDDWVVISGEFDKMNRHMPKVLATGPVPRIYIKTVGDLEDLVAETVQKQKESGKKMNANIARGFNAIKQKIKKNNKDYAAELAKYRASPDAYLAAQDAEDAAEAKKAAAAAAAADKSALGLGQTALVAGDDEGFATVGRGGKSFTYTPEGILKQLRAINESRGRKGADRAEQTRVMEKLLDIAVTPYQTLRILINLLSMRFDYASAPGSTATHMAVDGWAKAQAELARLVATLEAHPEFLVVENAEEWEDDEKQPALEAGQTMRVPGSVVGFVERLDDELTRSLQHVDPHTAEYIERLSDEQALYACIMRVQIYLEATAARVADSEDLAAATQDAVNRVVIRRLEHLYFKPTQVIAIIEDNMWKAIPAALDSAITPRPAAAAAGSSTASTASADGAKKLIQTLSGRLFEHADGILRARAMLCLIYFLALHDEYYRARDFMLMSHLSENISNFDISTQILFNRTLVQIGLCAFRAGLVYEAHNTLADICGSGRQKELLAQGIIMQRYSTVTPEQEKIERARQLPFHMHINLELLECIYLTSALFLEVPLMAQTSSAPETRRRMISKTFRRMLDYNERQVFNGPPENTRDGVIMAAKLLANGDWQRAAETITAIKIWDLMPQPAAIKTMLTQQMQEEGLRTYLFTYAPYYDSLALATLSTMFDLPVKKITALVSRMIAHEELAAALDQVNNAVVFRKGVELSRLQSQIVTLADKSMMMLENNEKILEHRTQGMANAFQRDQGNARRGGGRGGRGGARGGHFGGPGGRRPGGQQFGGGALGGVIKA